MASGPATRWLLIVALVGCACGPEPQKPPASSNPNAPPAAASQRAKALRFELSGTPDATDIARMIAMDGLRAQGYQVDTVSYASNPLLFVGMEHGDVDIVSVGDVVGWNAIRSGAPAFALVDESRMTLLVLAAKSITTCADLNGKPIATGFVNGANERLMRRYIEVTCPGTVPQNVVIQSAPSRLAALMSGAVVASTMELYDYIEMPKSRTDLHVLAWFSDVFPGVSSISTFMRRALADQYPETAKDIVREILRARRRVQDVDVLTNEIVQRLKLDPAQARTTAEAFLTRKIWDVNGGGNIEDLQRKMDFYQATDPPETRMRAEQVSNLSYLNAVLDEIGRQ